MQIVAWKCEETGKIFEEHDAYTKHVRKIAAARRKQLKAEKAVHDKIKFMEDNFWNRVRSLDQLKAAILQHCDVLALNGVENYWSSFRRQKLNPTPLTEFETFRLHWNENVSNSHSCPHNGVTNFGLKNNLPTGYPGWKGRFDYRVRTDSNQLHSYPGSSDMWRGTRIHTGTGGGGGHRIKNGVYEQGFGYDVRLFANDWPAMAAEYERAQVWLILKDDTTTNIDQLVNSWNPAETY